MGADDINVLEDYPGLEWKGEYSETVTYYKGAIIFYENGLYVMTSYGATGAIPGFDEEWELFGKYGVTEDDIKTGLGYTPADSTKYLPLIGGTLTGNLTGKYITGTWLQATGAGHLATVPEKIPVFDSAGWIYYRTPSELLSDIGGSSGYTLTEDDKTEIAGKVAEDGVEFTLVDMPTGSGLPTSTTSDAGKLLQVGANGAAAWGSKLPTALKNPKALTFTGAATGTYDGSAALTVNIPTGGSSGGSGGSLKALSRVSSYIGIPAAELPENGVVWMCIADGATNQEYYSGTITMQGGALSSNNMVSISSNGVIQLNQVTQVSGGIAIYGMSASAYTGVYQVVGAGGAAEATDRWTLYHEVTLTEAVDNWTLDLPSGCKRASIEVFPGAEVAAGWKSIAVNGITVPVTNGKIDNGVVGLLVELDVNAPVKIIVMRGASASKPDVNGVAPVVLGGATVMPQNITVMTSIGVQTGALLVAGCKIKVYTGG